MRSVEEEIEEEYDFIDKIGTGSFGHIISVRSKNNHSVYACKIEKNHGKVIHCTSRKRYSSKNSSISSFNSIICPISPGFTPSKNSIKIHTSSWKN
jgi:hypothetical protein